MKISIPYGKTKQELAIPDNISTVVLDPKVTLPENDPADVIKEAIANPMGTKSLKELVTNKNRVAILCDDYTRKLNNVAILDVLIPILEEYGLSRKNITLIMATGTHRQPTDAELEQVFGSHKDTIPFIAHDCDATDLKLVGKTSRGNEIHLNPQYVDADVRITLSDVGLHYYAGFGGGRKSILPGISSRTTICTNHAWLLDANAVAGTLDKNPVNEDMIEAANILPPEFAINVIQSGKRIVHTAAGDINQSFQKMVEKARSYFLHPCEHVFDVLIVSSGGYPTDLNVYQGSKAIEHTKCLVRNEGTLISVLQAKNGIGSEGFKNGMLELKSVTDAEDMIKNSFAMGKHKSWYWYDTLAKMNLCIVTDLDKDTVKDVLKVQKFDKLQAAFDYALTKVNSDPKIGIIPNGATFAFYRTEKAC